MGFYFINIQSKKRYKYSVNLVVPFCFSILFTISLLENYLASLSGEEDGISISNKLAYFILGDDEWTLELFRRSYEMAFWISLVILLLGTVSFLIEWNKNRRCIGMIRRFHHAQITIPKGKEEEARSFYCGILQLAEIPKPESLIGRGGFWVQVGSQQLHIGTEDGVDRLLTKAHLAYEVEDIGTIKKLLRDNGIEILESIPIPGYDRFEFRDPFGNRVECIKPV